MIICVVCRDNNNNNTAFVCCINLITGLVVIHKNTLNILHTVMVLSSEMCRPCNECVSVAVLTQT